jgi:hypothetical protein
MIVEQSVEWEMAGETEVHFVHHKSHMTWPGSNPGRRCGKPATNRLSYGTASGIWFVGILSKYSNHTSYREGNSSRERKPEEMTLGNRL